MNEYDLLTREMRMQRIAALLSKAVTLSVLADRETGRNEAVVEVNTKVETQDDDWISRGMVIYMERFGWATPREMLRYLDIKRTTMFRRLGELRKRGVVERRGHMHGTQYRILAGQVG